MASQQGLYFYLHLAWPATASGYPCCLTPPKLLLTTSKILKTNSLNCWKLSRKVVSSTRYTKHHNTESCAMPRLHACLKQCRNQLENSVWILEHTRDCEEIAAYPVISVVAWKRRTDPIKSCFSWIHCNMPICVVSSSYGYYVFPDCTQKVCERQPKFTNRANAGN